MEKFQKQIAKGHAAAKKALLSGGGENKPPYTQKPDYKRAKSAPPGFGALGEAENLGLQGGVAGGIKGQTIGDIYGVESDKNILLLVQTLSNKSATLNELFNQPEFQKQLQTLLSSKESTDKKNVFFLSLIMLSKLTYKNINQFNLDLEKMRLWKSLEKSNNSITKPYVEQVKKIITNELSVVPTVEKLCVSSLRRELPLYTDFFQLQDVKATQMVKELESATSAPIATRSTRLNNPQQVAEKKQISGRKIKVRLIRQEVEEDKLLSPSQVQKDKQKRIHKPKEREREKKTGIISPKFAKVNEF